MSIEKRPINVAVTGNAPFLEWNFNTSLLVRNALPLLIQRPNKPDIKIHKYARTTRDTYTDVRRVSKEIWSGQRSLFLPELGVGEEDETLDIDFILHLGMEVRDEFFGFETRARREGYKEPGDDGMYVDSAELEKEGLHAELYPKFDVEVAYEHVKSLFPDSKLRLSDDAGLYFCEFRLYSSLAEAELHHHDKRGMTLFQHIPRDHEPEDIELATNITAAYITALADDKMFQQNE